ncbi:MAG: caspase family protein [Saprospiraceae bacterium]|nr:caspase family protein [Saprospiraceae bacterium]
MEDITKVLVDQYSFEQAHVQVILDEQASRENIVDHLNALREIIQPQDRLLIYYSGHGYSDNERGYWIPVDAEHDHISSFVSNADILDIIKLIRARHILLISDSCFSGSHKDPSRYAFISGKGVVSDGNAGENSPFASGIIRHLQDNETDAINIVRLADQVTQEISFNYEQLAEISPLYGAGHKGGQYIFLKGKGKSGVQTK